ncbi:hypothetical protein J6524_18880 [Bradyrhizobium sp. WSM 1738]|uniref:phosphopantetheine-binding protein n=1 Tax=Bradyrhizobium hereditatis TaxID=2821405 RepID=UPI001CE3A44E|nr:phosphopantetheine-binding protein [Bradyrhizobium hereditatis]MCA6116925.1 hypothetical protein [Bradyrhizobium hereditatis]
MQRCGYEAPQGEIETTLAQLRAELLGFARVGQHDQLFALGGQSLLAVRLLSRALHRGLRFSTSGLFQSPVLKELASKIDLEPHRNTTQVLSVHATGSQPPLFFIPTVLRDCSYVLSLAIKELQPRARGIFLRGKATSFVAFIDVTVTCKSISRSEAKTVLEMVGALRVLR